MTSLSDMMEQADLELGEVELAAVMKQCLAALVYLHDVRRTIHRDIKAGNVLLTSTGECKLGIALVCGVVWCGVLCCAVLWCDVCCCLSSALIRMWIWRLCAVRCALCAVRCAVCS